MFVCVCARAIRNYFLIYNPHPLETHDQVQGKNNTVNEKEIFEASPVKKNPGTDTITARSCAGVRENGTDKVVTTVTKSGDTYTAVTKSGDTYTGC